MLVNLKTTNSLIKSVLSSIDKFNNKTAGETTWKYFHEMENDKTVPEEITDFSLNFITPPNEGTVEKFINYYTNALKEIKKAGINPKEVIFSINDDYMTVGMVITPVNNMSTSEYYKEVVFNKGQIISFQKENARQLDKVNQVHTDYTKSLDDELKKKLDELQIIKTQPFREIHSLLETAVAKLTEEEMKYKPVKKLKK